MDVPETLIRPQLESSCSACGEVAVGNFRFIQLIHNHWQDTPSPPPVLRPQMPEKLTWIKLNPYVFVSCQPNTPDGRIVVKDDDVSPSCVLLPLLSYTFSNFSMTQHYLALRLE